MENNIAISGDEARALMTVLLVSEVSFPSKMLLGLYMRLAQINQVQPPSETKS